MKSTNANDGTLTLKVSFEVGSNLDMDNVLTQNRVSQGMPQMPQSVKNYGVSVKKALAFPLLVISIKSPKGTYDSSFLSNYTTININDAIARIQGVGQINLFGGSDYAMRVWLRPDVIGAARPDGPRHRQRHRAAEPVDAGRPDRRAAGRGRHRIHLHRPHAGTPAERGGVRQHHRADDRPTAPRCGSRTSRASSWERCSTTPSAATTARPRPSSPSSRFPARTRSTSPTESSRRWPICRSASRATWSTWSRSTRRCRSPKASTRSCTRCSKRSCSSSSWCSSSCRTGARRSFPLMTVPVSLVGAFIFFPMLGFSINVLSLLGLVLAIGIVVDDAIVVVEAVMHHIEHGMAPKEATIKAMEEVSGPVVAIGLILSAVFVPVGFMGGITGRLYQQFAITIAISVLLSVVNALTLSPALAALLLKPAERQALAAHAVLQRLQQSVRMDDRPLRQLRRHPDPEDVPQPGVHRRARSTSIVVLVQRIPGRLRARRRSGLSAGQRAACPMPRRSNGPMRSCGRPRRFLPRTRPSKASTPSPATRC